MDDQYRSEEAQNCQEKDHRYKVFVIPFPNAVADPRAMMIKLLYATVAEAAMGSPRWSVNLACFAKF